MYKLQHMKTLFTTVIILFYGSVIFAQDIPEKAPSGRKNSLYVELAGRGYCSVNYERALQKNRIGFGFGWNDMETYLDPQEAIAKGVQGDHEASPYLLMNLQYSRLFGSGRSKLELGAGSVLTLFDLERMEFVNKLYESESFLSIYPLIGYRFEGHNGFLFMFTFNPLIQIPQGYFWPIPGISVGYRF